MLMTTIFSRALPALAVAAAVSVDMAAAGGFSICAEHNAANREMTLSFDNGCVSSSIKYLGNDIEADVSQIHASIRITGGFNYEALEPTRPVTADCAGGRQHTITVPETDARRYRVSHDGEFAGIIDFTAGGGHICATPLTAGDLSKFRLTQDWRKVDIAEWTPVSAPALMDVLAPIYSTHPESTEGQPVMTIEMRPWTGLDAMHVEIVMTGYLDDSVSGETFVAMVEPGGEGWVLKELWKRNLCSRGQHAGQWTSKPCP